MTIALHTAAFLRLHPVMSMAKDMIFSNTAITVDIAAKDIKQEEEETPDPSTCHGIEYIRQSDKDQTRSTVGFYAIGKAGRENDQTCHQRHKGIQYSHTDCLARQGSFLVNIAAKDCQCADTDTQGKE